MLRGLVLTLMVCGLAAQETPGVARCATCHRAQTLAQPATSMARALETVAECQILREHPRLEFRQGPYSYKITRNGERDIYTVSDGKETLTMPVAWAFGLGAAGQTYVYQWNGAWYESRVSFYRAIGGLDLTMGAGG